MTNKSKFDNQKSKKTEKFYIINNVYRFSNPEAKYNSASWMVGTGGEGLGAGNFTWPEYKTEKERIRMNTAKYAGDTIVEAFEKEYKLPIQIDSDSIVNNVPNELKIGDVINVDILNVSKRNVEFGSVNVKSNLMSTTDLYRYPKFRTNFRPMYNVPVKVVDMTKHDVKVDILSPQIDNFILPRVAEPWIQKKLSGCDTVRVENLQLTKGGFLGKAALPGVSDFLEYPYIVDVFIPGSQIVLNIATDFEQFIGQSVDAFVVNYIKNPVTGRMSLVCSVKEYLKFKGEEIMIGWFKNWCEDNDVWKKISTSPKIGKVTGIINSSKKTGVFVELVEQNITGMINVSAKELVNYKPGDVLKVLVTGFEEEMFYNQTIQQTQHVEPYKITNNCIEKCNLKPILTLAE